MFFLLVWILCALSIQSRKKLSTWNMVLMRNLWNFSFFGRGDVSPTLSKLCRFVLGVTGKTPGLISRNNFIKKIVCIVNRDNVIMQDVTRSSLCSRVKECGTKRAHNFLFPKSSFRIRRTTVLRMFKDSAIILDAIRRSFLTKSATAALFTSVRVDCGRPPLSSSCSSSKSRVAPKKVPASLLHQY
jgi:hypothetical protein